MAFKVGDVVKLKSGGADMTVSRVIDLTGQVECVWHSTTSRGGHDKREAFYPPKVLELRSEYDARGAAQATADRDASIKLFGG